VRVFQLYTTPEGGVARNITVGWHAKNIVWKRIRFHCRIGSVHTGLIIVCIYNAEQEYDSYCSIVHSIYANFSTQYIHIYFKKSLARPKGHRTDCCRVKDTTPPPPLPLLFADVVSNGRTSPTPSPGR
jgi:hypothetical protein